MSSAPDSRTLLLDDLKRLWVTYRDAPDRSFEQAAALERLKQIIGTNEFLIMAYPGGLTTLVGKHIARDVRAAILETEEARQRAQDEAAWLRQQP